ncbi:MAG: hypothetical protein ACK56I_19380, partial [bacterium]
LKLNAIKLPTSTIKEYFEQIIQSFQVTLNSKNITVAIVEPADVPNDQLCTDFRIFEEIVYHLFANAVKYSDSSQTINVEITFRGP